MDHKTDEQEPSGTKGGQVQVGDFVWVKCKVIEPCESLMKVTPSGNDNWFWAGKGQCRPVEPSNSPKIPNSSSESMRAAFEADSNKRYGWNQGYFGRIKNRYFDSFVEMLWQSFQAGAKYQSSPLAPSPCMDGVDADQFIEGVMEARGRTSDPINPSHYRQGGIECIEAMKVALGSGFLGYLRGNAIKYLWRYDKKNGVEDLKKARWYLDRLIQEVGE